MSTTNIGPCNCCGGVSCYFPEGAVCVVEWDSFFGTWISVSDCVGKLNPDGTGPSCIVSCEGVPNRNGAYHGEQLTFSCN
jgi:hypothetical protein